MTFIPPLREGLIKNEWNLPYDLVQIQFSKKLVNCCTAPFQSMYASSSIYKVKKAPTAIYFSVTVMVSSFQVSWLKLCALWLAEFY